MSFEKHENIKKKKKKKLLALRIHIAQEETKRKGA
jgi:hypothetical protein